MKIFLSAVSAQFKTCREALRSDLSAVGAEVLVQEDFQQHGGTLLEKLQEYIAACDRVIVLVGDAYGWEPEEAARPVGRPRRSYSQWEYYFARGERLDGQAVAPKDIYLYFAAPEFSAAHPLAKDDAATLQAAFIDELRAGGKDWSAFKSMDELRALVLRDGFRLDERDPKLRDVAQGAHVQGDRNILVQIQGDNNRVDIQRPYLSLVRYGLLPVRDSIGLLYAQARAIDLYGRDATLADLTAWATGPAPLSMRVIVGGGGSGKTRLAMELCDRLAEADWHAGFVTRNEMTRFASQQNLATWGWPRPTLIVVDYAASRARQLGDWLTELASHPGGAAHPLRVLLLERHADPDTGWWQEAFGIGGHHAYAIRGLLDPPQPVRLEPLAPEARRQVLDAMLVRLGSAGRAPAPGRDARFDALLASLTWGGDPLYLMIAASRAAQLGMGHLLTLTRVDLVQSVADAERARVTRHAQTRGIADAVLLHMAAVVTLRGGLSWDEAATAASAELDALRRQGSTNQIGRAHV
jgi:hypothetical protein